MTTDVSAVLLAAGQGRRMAYDTPKQFIEIAGKPIFIYSLEKFDKIKEVGEIVLVVPKDQRALVPLLLARYSFTKQVRLVTGADTRQGSSFEGVKACGRSASVIVVHDAARPFAGTGVFESVITAARSASGATCAVDCRDTIAMREADHVREVPDRKSVVQVQTPQAFNGRTIRQAHVWARRNGLENFTDDCGMVFAMGGEVKLVDGDPFNVKITRPSDLRLAESILSLVKEKGGPSEHVKEVIDRTGSSDRGDRFQ